MGLHAWSISYCDHTLSDGFIPNGAYPALPGIAAAVKRLVEVGLWLPTTGGYLLHDYTDYNRTKAQVEAYMAAKTAAGQAGGQASAQARAQRSAQASAQAKLKQDLKQNPTPGPGPGPGPGVTSLAAAAAASPGISPQRRYHLAHARDGLPLEVIERLSLPPIRSSSSSEKSSLPETAC